MMVSIAHQAYLKKCLGPFSWQRHNSPHPAHTLILKDVHRREL